MNISYENFKRIVKTKSELSSLVKNLWISKAVVNLNINGAMKPIFGFSANFDRQTAELRSTYELLEHLAFLPHIYDEITLNKSVVFFTKKLRSTQKKGVIKNFLVGAMGPKGLFYGNGCAISNNLENAITHSQRELIERHICCEIWYNNCQITQESKYKINLLTKKVKLNLYTSDIMTEHKFAIAIIDYPEKNFFIFGAAIRKNIEEAYSHALSEAAMIFEDAIKKRVDNKSPRTTRLLSLRNETISSNRRKYFENLLNNTNHQKHTNLTDYQSIFFEPFPNIYAARTFSTTALDPRELELKTKLPTLPLC